jgi:hypothetical protein
MAYKGHSEAYLRLSRKRHPRTKNPAPIVEQRKSFIGHLRDFVRRLVR